jgi:protein tyrosine/serine phosphatase
MKQEPKITIKNFRQVTPWLYRGGQPEKHEFDQLVNLGIKTIISFRWDSKAIAREQSLTGKAHLHLVSIPLAYWVLPNQNHTDQFFSTLDDPSMRPIFVHCMHGCDRTGLFIAMYRIAKENWTADAAYQEMKDAGFHKIRLHHYKWLVYAFARRFEQSRPLKR